MKEPWDEFLDIYREKLEDGSHGEAVVDALFDLLVRLDEGGWSDYGVRSARLKETTDRWEEEGGADWDDLRERLQESWLAGE